MAEANQVSQLDSENWDRLQQVVERFEAACANNPADVADFLPPVTDSLYGPLLLELVRTDLELHWRRGHQCFIESYLTRFPLLRTHQGLALLVHDECRLRRKAGERPALEEYRARFPELADRLLTSEGLTVANSGPPGEMIPAPSALPYGAASDAGLENSGDDSGFALATRMKKLHQIGRGAFGEVWAAQAPGGVPIAIKCLLPSVSKKALERERLSLDLICSGHLRHPFLLQVFGWWLHHEQLYIAMELADASLEDWLKQARATGATGLSRAKLARVMRDAADALDFLNHERNILHRDVKPANMLLMANRLKLCDFGLARMTENLALAAGKTLGAGTPVFMAPEIIEGFQTLQSDQYSLAVSYYLLRCGQPLFSGKVEAIRDQHLHAEPALDYPDLAPHERAALRKALSKQPEDRFANSGRFVEALLSDAPVEGKAFEESASERGRTLRAPLDVFALGPESHAPRGWLGFSDDPSAAGPLAGRTGELGESSPAGSPGLPHGPTSSALGASSNKPPLARPPRIPPFAKPTGVLADPASFQDEPPTRKSLPRVRVPDPNESSDLSHPANPFGTPNPGPTAAPSLPAEPDQPGEATGRVSGHDLSEEEAAQLLADVAEEAEDGAKQSAPAKIEPSLSGSNSSSVKRRPNDDTVRLSAAEIEAMDRETAGVDVVAKSESPQLSEPVKQVGLTRHDEKATGSSRKTHSGKTGAWRPLARKHGPSSSQSQPAKVAEKTPTELSGHRQVAHYFIPVSIGVLAVVGIIGAVVGWWWLNS